MGEILSAIFGGHAILETICIAMLPLVELKGAIPLGIKAGLVEWQAFWWALLGSSLVVPIVALLFRPIYLWLKDKKFFKSIVDFLVGDLAKRSDQIQTENQTKSVRRALWLKIFVVFLFVAFPVPGTGVWTGTCFAVLLGLNFWVTCVTVITGNVICGLIITFVCKIFPQLDILIIVFLLLIVAVLLTRAVIHAVRKRRVVASEE